MNGLGARSLTGQRPNYDRRIGYQGEMTDGNAARRLEVVPVRREERARPVRPAGNPQPAVRTRTRKRQKKQGMDGLTCLIVFVSICCMFYICTAYVGLQFEISSLDDQVIELEKDVADLKKQNDAQLEMIESSIDLDAIYKKATKELGMVHAKRGQVLTYDGKKSDRVRQYADIPE